MVRCHMRRASLVLLAWLVMVADGRHAAAGIDAWTSVGPPVAWPFYAHDPLASQRVFVGHDDHRALFRSVDGGRRYSHVLSLGSPAPGPAAHRPVRVSVLTADARVPDRLYLGTTTGRYLASNDGGATWTEPGGSQAIDGAGWTRLGFSPWDADFLYGVRGNYFQRMAAGDTGFSASASAFDVSPREDRPGDWVRIDALGIHRSVDDGATWVQASGVGIGAIRGARIGRSPVDPALLVASLDIDHAQSGRASILYVSRNAGTSWVEHSQTVAVTKIRGDPVVATTFYLGGAGAVVRLDGLGEELTGLQTGEIVGDFDVPASGHVCVTTRQGSLCSSERGEVDTFRNVASDLPGDGVQRFDLRSPWVDLAVDDGQHPYPGQVESKWQRVQRQFGHPEWEPAATEPWSTPWCGDEAIAPSDPRQRMRFGASYFDGFGMVPGCLFRSYDGVTWANLAYTSLNASGEGAFAVAFDPQDANVIWLARRSGLFRSGDGGTTWSRARAFRFDAQVVRSIVIDPSSGNRMAVVSVAVGGSPGSIHVSDARGFRFLDMTGGLVDLRAADVDWSTAPPRVYAATGSGVWAATWGATDWQLVGESPALVVNDVKVVAPRGVASRVTLVASTTTGIWEFTRSDGLPFTPVHRFFDAARGVHIYTASEDERDHLLSASPRFVHEGPQFTVLAAPAAGAVPVWRFDDPSTGGQFFTHDAAEREGFRANHSQAVDRGIAFYAFRSDPGTASVYRFVHKTLGSYFFTASLAEILGVIQEPLPFYYEGDRWSAYPVPGVR